MDVYDPLVQESSNISHYIIIIIIAIIIIIIAIGDQNIWSKKEQIQVKMTQYSVYVKI